MDNPEFWEEETDLHSDKVRKLLGEMPKFLLIYGIAVTAIVCIGLIAAVCLLPYPYSDGESILTHLLRNHS